MPHDKNALEVFLRRPALYKSIFYITLHLQYKTTDFCSKSHLAWRTFATKRVSAIAELLVTLLQIIRIICAVDGGTSIFNTLVKGKSLYFGLRNLASRKYKHDAIVWTKVRFDISNRLCVDHECVRQIDRTDFCNGAM